MNHAAQSARRTMVFGRETGLLVALAATLMFILSVLAYPAAAQQAPDGYSDQELQAFAAAALKVEQLNEKWIPQIAEAENADEDAALRQEAMQEMRAAVQEEGLSVQDYNTIYDAAQRDPQVMQVIEDHRESLR
ncbi:MAG: DUF4168 domain-containing protein [Kiloniellaceae bacterium]